MADYDMELKELKERAMHFYLTAPRRRDLNDHLSATDRAKVNARLQAQKDSWNIRRAEYFI